MHLARIGLFLFLLVVAATAAPKSLTLAAGPGKFNANTLRAAGSTVEINGTMRIVAYAGTKAWPTAAHIGIHQGPNRNHSVQVLVIRNAASDQYLVVGYRLVIDGKEAKVESIENVAIGATVRVGLTFKRGLATIRVNSNAPIEISTPFQEVAPYVSVSSGESEFAIDP